MTIPQSGGFVSNVRLGRRVQRPGAAALPPRTGRQRGLRGIEKPFNLLVLVGETRPPALLLDELDRRNLPPPQSYTVRLVSGLLHRFPSRLQAQRQALEAERELSQSQRYQKPLALLFIDLDGFQAREQRPGP